MSRAPGQACQVAVVGGGLGGLLAAAIVARQGRDVVLLERAAAVGGRLRSFDVEGGYIVDAGAYLWPDAHFSEALRRAGADDFRTSEIAGDRVLRLYVEGQGGRRQAFPFPLRTPSAKMLASAAVALDADEETYAGLCELWQRLAALTDAEVERLRLVPLRQGLGALSPSPTVAEAFRRNVMLYGSYDPDAASMAECIELCRRPAGRNPATPVVAGNNRVGGVRALVAALAGALSDAGVRVEIDARVERIEVDAGRACAVHYRRGDEMTRLAAESIVCDVPIDRAIDLFDRSLLPDELVDSAGKWSAVGGVIAAAYAFRGMPHLNDGGAQDDFPGWTRLLTGPDREFGGGMLWTTMHSPHNAPPGHHLLQAMRLSPRSDVDDPSRVAAVHDSFERMLAEIYSDAAERMLWSRRWTTADGTEYMVATARRPPVRSAFAAGLYFVGETTDVQAVQMDAAALSALHCAEMILG